MSVEVTIKEINIVRAERIPDGTTLYTGNVVVEAGNNPPTMVGGSRFTIDFVRTRSLDEAAEVALQRLSKFAAELQAAIAR